nr:hypothetical protein BaRGS_004805 [Batillaria attramentaria]
MYPYHMGLQHERFHANTPAYVPSNYTFLSQYMKHLGYETQMVGKWHLGFCNTKYTPAERGFDDFFGFYTDDLDYYTHKDKDGNYDFWHNENVAQNIDGLYSTSLLSGWAVNRVRNHDVGVPLFMVLAYQAIHLPAQVPQDPARQTVCGMVAAMDEGIGNLTAALRSKDMLDDTVIIFTSDNGGNIGHGSSNSPLKGGNGELYEGGTRVTTLLASTKLTKTNYTFEGLFHQVDWLPTIVSIAGGDTVPIIRETDGFDQWQAIRLGGPSPRRELVYNFDDTVNNHFHNGAIRVGDLKLVNGPADFSHHVHENNTGVQLYDLSDDPLESVNLAANSTDKVQELVGRMKELRKSLVPAADPKPSAASDPDDFDGVWSPGWWICIGLYAITLIVFIVVAVLVNMHVRRSAIQPHVIFIIADDLGWSDVSWRDPDMRTPNLETLLQDGVLINQSYVHPLDGPSRAAIFTGVYPFHMGLQHNKMRPYVPVFVPEKIKLLPQYLKKLGYDTHMVGKWHLGFCDMRYTPRARGFESFYGSYTDGLDHYTHKDVNGHYDFRHNENLAYFTDGKYSTELLSDWVVNVVNDHDPVNPLFVMLAYQAIHSPMQAPEKYVNGTCSHIKDPDRQTVCGMVAAMDEGIGNVTEALRSKDMLDDTVIIFTSDNGGITAHGSSNSPLKGVHGLLYEGGTRVPTFLSGGRFLSKTGHTYQGLFHQVDWLPTIVSLAKGDPVLVMHETDGLNHWHDLREGRDTGPRTEVVYNVDDVFKDHLHTGAIRDGQYKLIHGPVDFGEETRDVSMHSQLYDLHSDPWEKVDLGREKPEVTQRLLSRIKELRKTLVKGVDAERDPKSDPANFDGSWSYGWC